MSQPQITIRPATKKDIPTIIEFQKKLSEETEFETLDDQKVTAGVAAVFDDPAKGCYYVAEVDGQVVGCFLTTYEWSDWGNAQVLWLASLYVQESWRGKGIFRSMYAYLKDLVESNPKYKGIRLYVNTSNTKAENVYKKLGMNGDHYKLYEWMK